MNAEVRKSEVEYRPVKGDVEASVRELQPARLLVVGLFVPISMVSASETRLVPLGSTRLPVGTYTFLAENSWHVLYVGEGTDPVLPYRTSWDDAEDWHVQPYGWFQAWWPDAVLVAPPAYQVDDEVVLVPSGQEGRVRKVISAGQSWSFEVRVARRTITCDANGLKLLVVDDDPLEWISREPQSADRFAATLTRAKLAERLTDTVFSFRASRTVFRPYQFRPVIRLLATGQLRLLIADEVGLGKTIEAGLVWTEFDARNMANRVLVVCPASLVSKWRWEMRERFDFDLTELTTDRLNEFLEQVEEGRLPTRLHAVCSLERMRAWEGLERLVALSPHFDLIIADEAHAFRNAGTKSNALGSFLADWADALVFLSATPLNLGNDDLFNLLQLLSPADFTDRVQLEPMLEPNAVLNRIASSLLDREVSNAERRGWVEEIRSMTFGPALTGRPEFGDLTSLLAQDSLTSANVAEVRRAISHLHALSAVVTRTRKAEIQEEKAVRELVSIEVIWTESEREFHEAFRAWQLERARYFSVPVAFVTQMPLRLASSCLPMAAKQLLDGHWDFKDEDEDELDASWMDQRELLAPPPELVGLALQLGTTDTKFDEFIPVLRRLVNDGKQVLVFTFARPTLAYLERRLESEFRVAALHGGIDSNERREIMRDFRNGEFDVVVASRVASEGLDFEFCSAVVNYDLPWNPMEVEQRIGRIDRFGQQEEKVYVVNFLIPGTIESDIVSRLMTRIGVFEDSIGALEPIVQEHMEDIKGLLDFSLSPEQRTAEMDRFMAVIEETKLAKSEVEDAASFLSSTDGTEIDGLEMDLLRTGRYVGQSELQLLLQDWADLSRGSGHMVFADGAQFVLRGTAEMEQQLWAVQARAERSQVEIDRLASMLRNELDIILYLDQERARRSGGDLLTANHPLVRAALGVPGHVQARFASLQVGEEIGVDRRFLVMLAVATWEGVRRSVELWTEAVPLDGGADSSEAGDVVLASLAEGTLADAPMTIPIESLKAALGELETKLADHQSREGARKRTENDALVNARRISLEQTYEHKVTRIEGIIRTLRERDTERMVGLQMAQLRTQDHQYRRKLAELHDKTQGSLQVERIAVCVVSSGGG